MPAKTTFSSVGILGFGAFGRLIARHLHRHFRIIACDPGVADTEILAAHAHPGGLREVGDCDVVILAVPVTSLTLAVRQIRPFLRPGCLVIDVGSVKVTPARVMLAELPPGVDILGTHPLFGPQSARDGIAGRKIAICPLRCRSTKRTVAFLRNALGLEVHVTTPEEHDREAATVQGLTHLIGNVLCRMGPLPDRLTTASFDLLKQAIEMVRYDAASVYHAIEQENPFAAEVRQRFFALADDVRAELDKPAKARDGRLPAVQAGSARGGAEVRAPSGLAKNELP